MARFRAVPALDAWGCNPCNPTETAKGLQGDSAKGIDNKGKNKNVTHVTHVTRVTRKKDSKRIATGDSSGGGGIATSDIFRAKITAAAHGYPVDSAVVLAEFANDQQDIAAGVFSDATIRQAVQAYLEHTLKLHKETITSPATDGMVQCVSCGHYWQKCRHPTKHGERWGEVHEQKWRQCGEYRGRL